MAFYMLEPFGQEWLQSGTVAAVALQPHVKKGHKCKPTDFLPVAPPESPDPEQTGEEMLAIFKMMYDEQERRKRVNNRKS